jgi:hypothetical protein
VPTRHLHVGGAPHAARRLEEARRGLELEAGALDLAGEGGAQAAAVADVGRHRRVGGQERLERATSASSSSASA